MNRRIGFLTLLAVGGFLITLGQSKPAAAFTGTVQRNPGAADDIRTAGVPSEERGFLSIFRAKLAESLQPSITTPPNRRF